MLDPLEHQYKTLAKLDYFILTSDLALLGWTVVNTSWLPTDKIFKILMVIFWSLLGVSIVAGVVKQLYAAMAFGANHYMIYTAELASQLERASLSGGVILDQQSGNPVTPEHISNQAATHRDIGETMKKEYGVFSSRMTVAGNVAIVLLVVALLLLTALKALAL